MPFSANDKQSRDYFGSIFGAITLVPTVHLLYALSSPNKHPSTNIFINSLSSIFVTCAVKIF